MPPEPPLVTSTVAIDKNGNAWLYEPAGIAKPLDLMPLGGTNPGTTPPANPRVGDLWWDSGVNELKVWNGTAWVVSAGGGSGGIGEPTTAGSFLRTDTGTWVAGLPLTLAAPTTVTGSAANSLTVTGDLSISRVSAGAATTLLVANNQAAGGTGSTTRITLQSGTNTSHRNLLTFTSNSSGLMAGAYQPANAVVFNRAQGTASGAQGGIIQQMQGIDYWRLLFSGATTSNFDFSLARHNATGVFVDSPLSVNWNTGAVTILNLILPGLPTADPGIPGAVWNNAGVLNISP